MDFTSVNLDKLPQNVWTGLSAYGDTTGTDFGSQGVVGVPLSLCSVTEVSTMLDSVGDVLDGSFNHNRLLWEQRRNQAAIFSDNPTMFVLEYRGVPSGWAGWLPYVEEDAVDGAAVWQSTTYFSPQLRRRGLLEYTSCLQYHLKSHIIKNFVSGDDAGGAGGTAGGTAGDIDNVVFVSSVDVFNTRSVQSRTLYAKKARWDPPVQAWESKRERTALIWRWADEHSLCFLGDKHLGARERQLLLLG